MKHEFRFTAEKIEKRIALVHANRFRAKRPFEPFRLQALDGALAAPDLTGDTSNWLEVQPGDYWGGANFHFCLRSSFHLPTEWSDPALHLPLGEIGDIFNHPEALIYLDGQILGSADRYHHTIPVDAVSPGRHEIALQGWTGWVGWPPEIGARDKLLMRQCHIASRNPALDELLAYATCTLETARLQDRDSPLRNALLDALDDAFIALDTREPLDADFHRSAGAALAILRGRVAEAGAPLDADLTAIGHAHMDIAYLWPVEESRQKNARTYSNVLRLMDRHPGFTFSHSQPQLYDYTRQDYPEIFEKIRDRVSEGRWEPVGGMWVEPDVNLAGAEALVRQILLGRLWFREAFSDIETPVLWLPDTFGFTWCLPQLMKLSGLEMLVTNKPNWNQHNRMPSSTTWWEGIDGTRVLAHVLTTPRDVQYLPFPTNYKSDLTGAEVLGTWSNATQPALKDLPICFGYGDGGGGPTENLVARAKAFADMPGMPRLRMGRVSDVLDTVKAISADLPTWRDELYMEGHRGVLTTQGWIKRANRRAEAMLHRSELLSVLAGIHRMPEPLMEAWKLLCLNQFHDVLTGTSVSRVFDDARQDYARIADICSGQDASALGGLSGGLGVLNPSPLPRHSLATTEEAPPAPIVHQAVDEGFLVDLPKLRGYEAKPLGGSEPGNLSVEETSGGFVLENAFIRAEIGPDGTVAGLLDKRGGRKLLAPGGRGNQLWAFEDRPIGWDAWDIDPFFEDRAEEISGLDSLSIIERGPLRVAVRVERTYRNSHIIQDIRLTDRSPRLEFSTEIDWQDSHVLLKAAFPLAIEAPHATYDIQWGQIDRPTTRDTIRDASRFEVCGHKWAALHEGDFAVALLNDGKYGHDVRGNVMRLTLLKSPTKPDPQSDRGRHVFTYAILPQSGSGFGEIRAEAEALNQPVLVGPGVGELPLIVAAEPANVVVETVKPSQDGNGFVARLYESEGRATSATLTFAHSISRVTECDLLEDPIRRHAVQDGAVQVSLQPFQILTLRVVPEYGQ